MNIFNLAKAAAVGVTLTALTATGALALEAEATGAVNVRSGPGTSYGILDQLRGGQRVDISRQSGGWCLVSKAGPDGWVSCRYLSAYGDSYDDDRYVDRRVTVRPNVTFSFGFSTGDRGRPGWNHGHWNDNDHRGDWDGPRWPRNRDRDNS
jgi:uncharacterized protein YraI